MFEKLLSRFGAALVFAALSVTTAQADVFNMGGTQNADGTWTGLASLETVAVGNLGNTGELSGAGAGGSGPDRICGAVDYAYNIGKYEVAAGQYCEFLNAVAKKDTYRLYDIGMWGNIHGCKIRRTYSSGSYTYNVAADQANRPVTHVSWGDAARFANWLHNGQPTGEQGISTTEDGSYYLNGATTQLALMAVTRKTTATWVIPTEDEWYKAAYHKNDGDTCNYFDYPTGSDSEPSNDLIDPDPGNNANFYQNDYTLGSSYSTTEVGEFENSGSPYGTFDQGGNLWEWNETEVNAGTSRGIRGGRHGNYSSYMLASCREDGDPTAYNDSLGFRVARVPEPGGIALLLCGVLAGLMWCGFRK